MDITERLSIAIDRYSELPNVASMQEESFCLLSDAKYEIERLRANWLTEQKARLEEGDVIALWAAAKSKAEIERLRKEASEDWKTEYVVRFRLLRASCLAACIEQHDYASLYRAVMEAIDEHDEKMFAVSQPGTLTK